MKKRIIGLCLSALSTQVFAHGWQTLPLTRVEYLYQTDRAAVGYEPQSVASLLVAGGSSTYAQITAFSGGPLGFFRKNHAIQNGNLCSNGHTAWPKLLNPLPADKVTKVADGQVVNFAWTKTAAHMPSNHFTFITNYKAGAYNPTPSWQDLNYLPGCDANGTSKGTDNYNCKLQIANQKLQSKQVIVSIWQRVDPVGENFVSCADVEFDGGGAVVTPSWTPIDSKSWISSITQPKSGELVTFKLTKNNNVIATYSLSITASNISKWDSILAAKINTDRSLDSLAAVGVLDKTTGVITYDEINQSKDYLYINKGITNVSDTYGYTLTKQHDTTPITVSWSSIGYKLTDWLQTVSTGDKLSFALNRNGIETDTISNVTVTSASNAEKILATAINKHIFKNDVKVRAGVLTNGKVSFITGGKNQVFVYKSSDSIDELSYVVRNTTPTPTPIPTPANYQIYPSGIGSYVAGSLVKGTDGNIYECKPWPYTAWCNGASHAYSPGSGSAWDSAWTKH